MKNIFKILFVGLLFITVVSCGDEFLDNEQFSTTPQEIASVNDLKALMYGAYIESRNVAYYGRDMIVFGTLRGDIAFNDAGSGRFRGVSFYNMISTNDNATDTFKQIYAVIAQLNIIINSDFQDPSRNLEIQNIKGQALVWRANAYFDLLKLFGQEHTGGALGVPLVLTYSRTGSEKPSRATIAETHSQIAADFEAGIAAISNSGSASLPDKDLLNLYSANGLAARYYLYKGTTQGDNASLQLAYDRASVVVNSGAYSVVGADLYIDSFSQNLTASNSVFELAVGDQAKLRTTSIAYMYSDIGYGDINALRAFGSSFVSGDVREDLMVPFYDTDEITILHYDVEKKYPAINGSNSIKILRYEEVLLTRAEANIRLGVNLIEADSDVNAVVTNRGLAGYTGVTLIETLEERKKELFFEGIRYFDMLRLGMNIPSWKPNGDSDVIFTYGSENKLAFPIPQRELDVNRNMLPNPGF